MLYHFILKCEEVPPEAGLGAKPREINWEVIED